MIRFFPSTIRQGGGGLPYVPPLDGATNMEVAYSVRKLRTAYTGFCMRVSDGSIETDIGFDSNGYLDTATLLGLGANLWIVTWYDQSGNVNDATVPFADAPKIVDASTLVTVNGLAAPFWTANTKYLKFSLIQGKTILFVAKNNTLAASLFTAFWYSLLNNDGILTGGTNSNVTGLSIYDALSFKARNTVEDLNQNLHSFFADPTNTIYTNGANSNTSATPMSVLTVDTLGRTVNSGSNSNWSIIGHIQEIITFSEDKIADRITLESNINDYFTIF